MTLSAIRSHIDTDHPAAVERLKTFLAIPSVSADSAFKPHILAAADNVEQQLQAAGLQTRQLDTGGHPAVIALSPNQDPTKPTVLFYGHYDVQPPDPLDGWTTPPFEPTLRGDNLFARGASDDKGQVACFIEALRAWHQSTDQFPCNIKVLIEGEEEVGSENLAPLLERHKDTLAADIVIVSDTSMYDMPDDDKGNPRDPVVAITYALRGLVYFDIQLHGPDRDLHSGVYGGTLANPANLLTRVLGKLIDDDNRVTIPGFYDDVAPVTPEERVLWDKLAFDEKTYLDPVGAQPFGEKDHDTLARRWARPSCDINGLYGGYMGEGAKTVIPTFAGAKVSFRIPANMDPHKTADQFESWLRSQNVGDLAWNIQRHGEAAPVATPIDSPFMNAANRAVQTITGAPPALVREGATIPVVADFQKILGIDTLLIGFGLNADNIHSPDEHFALSRFKLGCHTHAALIHELAKDIDGDDNVPPTK